jgi:large subunit ribosomal protein L3
MTIGLVGRKVGMTRMFTEAGVSLPITVLEILPNNVTQVKTQHNEGYTAIQVTTGSCKANRVTKPLAGHYAKANLEAGRGLWEFTTDATSTYKVGDSIQVDLFQAGQIIDVIATSKGKGFAGVVKRHNFRTQDATHGNSLSHRAPGSIGQNQSPGRVFKGKKMAGHLGAVRCTVQNLEIIKVDIESNLLLIRGAVPGAPGGNVIVKSAVKATAVATTA